MSPPAKNAALAAPDPYIESEEAISSTPYAAVISRAGRQLRSGRADPATLAAMLQFLVGTVPDPDAFDYGGSLPTLAADAPPSAPTAANPRAFRGTKFKPPKAKLQSSTDLIRLLDGGRGEADLLRQLAPHLDAALAAIDELAPSGDDPLRPLGQCWPASDAARLAAMPARFRRYFLWALRGARSNELSEVITMYWALNLGENLALCRIVAAIVSRMPAASVIACTRAIERVAPHRRNAFAELLLETRAFYIYDGAPYLVDRAEALCADDDYRHRIHFLLGAVHGVDYALDGFELANLHAVDHEFCHHGTADGVLPAVRRAMSMMTPINPDRFAMTLWERCADLDGFADLLAMLPWDSVAPQLAFDYVELLAHVVYSDVEGAALAAKWATLRERADILLAVLRNCALPDKALAHIGEIVWLWDKAPLLARALDRYIELLPRLCCPPFATDSRGRDPLASLTRLPDDAWAAIVASPDTSFVRLEKESRRKNDMRRIGHGLWTLARECPELTATAFDTCPGPLFDAAKDLAGLREPAREALLRSLPVRDPDTMALVDLVAAVPPSLVSRKLRQHVDGEVALSDGQVETARRRIVTAWPQVRLDAIAREAIDRLGAGVGAPATTTAGERHALLFQASSSEHRRAVRKLLKAHFAGDSRYLRDHPRNRNWLAGHPNIDADLWTNGIELRRDALVLGVERDPLEVLRVGTYVGSCLGIGGGLAYSAVAITLDINKQVVYCRDDRDRVVARQILALTDGLELVCFLQNNLNRWFGSATGGVCVRIRLGLRRGLQIFIGMWGIHRQAILIQPVWLQCRDEQHRQKTGQPQGQSGSGIKVKAWVRFST